MAIYKPTDCSPFNGTFDLSSDLPIIFECKIDTSNSPVTGYSIEIYNSNNEIIFPDGTTGPIESNVTYLTDLKRYVKNKFPSLVSNIRNVNSGLNGTVLEIPAIVNSSDVDNDTTVGRNQIGIVSGETNILVDGQTYTWKITLYQEVENGTKKTFPPAEEKFYDMTVASGTVIGSNEKRIQTALIDSDDTVVDNLALIDKFVQPIKIDGLSGYNPADQATNPVTSWTGDVPTTFTMTRSLITGYDSTYGYVYPSTAEGNAFANGQIVPESANGFQIFKNGNNPANLTATDMVEFVYDGVGFKGNMTWKTSAAKPEQSYWEQVYTVDSDPAGVFYPLTGDGYSTFALTGSERIIFNNIQKPKVQYGKIYYGSPYNGIFEPHFSSKKTDGETPVYQVTVVWNRTSDAANWGTLSNKIVYCRRDGKNYEINTTTQVGEINKTPFKFVEEKPVRIFNTATKKEELRTGAPCGNNSYMIFTYNAIYSIISIKNIDNVDVTKDCAFEVGKEYLIYTPSSANSSSLGMTVEYVPFYVRDYTGVIFYNKQATADQDTGIVYIRPSININKNMIFKEAMTTANPTWFNISYFNKDYNYITYTGNEGFNPEIDKTRYQIKSFYKDSDYNPFSIYKNPEIVSIISGNVIDSDGATNAITTRNFTVTSTYSQNSYIQWKSYQWILYDSAKRTILEKTDERYDGEITATFYGLDPQKYYILSLILQTNTGKIIEIDYVIYSDFTETAEQRDLVDAEFDCDTLSMKASLLKLLDVVLAPDADAYLPGTPSTTENTAGTAYYYNSKSNFYKKDNQTIASIDNGILTITGQNSLDFSKAFDRYDLEKARTGDIQIDADEIVVEGSFNFSEDYSGDIFSVSRGEGGTGIVQISIPKAIKSIDSDGFVILSDDINKVQIGPNSYLRIIDKNGIVSNSNEWQDSSEFHNTSIWKIPGAAPNGNRINVANFKYAEVKNGGTYNKSTYLNIAGPYNSYDEIKPLKDPMNPAEQKFSFMSGDNPPIDAISKICSDGPFYINQPDRLIWLDYKPCKEQMDVVQNTDKNGIPVVDKQSVCVETPLYWDDNAIWKDGIYVTKGLEKTLIGQVSVNGTVVESDYLEKSGVEYSSSGLTKQIQVAQNITERKSIANYEFAFKVFINTNNFSVDQLRSRCYVKAVLPKLSTPQNVTVNGNILSFDSVENAEKYEIFAGTISIGETAGISVSQEGTTLTIYDAPAKQSGTEVTIE